MKCDVCREDKDMWTELFTVKKKDHMPNNPKQWLVCKACYPAQREISTQVRAIKCRKHNREMTEWKGNHFVCEVGCDEYHQRGEK